MYGDLHGGGVSEARRKLRVVHVEFRLRYVDVVFHRRHPVTERRQLTPQVAGANEVSVRVDFDGRLFSPIPSAHG